MRCFFILSLASAIVLMSCSVAARTVPLSLGQILERSSIVEKVVILSGDTLPNVKSTSRQNCGYLYHASVNQLIKGVAGLREFRSVDELQIGAAYLLLVDSRVEPVFKVNAPPDSGYMSEHEVECARTYNKFRSLYGGYYTEILPFDESLEALTGEVWLRVPYDAIQFPNDIRVTTATVSADKGLAGRGRGPIDMYQLVKWADLKTLLSEK